MDKPNYVIHTQEAVLMPKNPNSPLYKIRAAVWIAVAILFVGSFVFPLGQGLETRLLLIFIAIGACFLGPKKINVPSPFEIRFYDTFMVIYRPKRYYDRKTTRREFYKIMYSDVTKCVYQVNIQRLHIYGTVYAVWFNYKKDGSVNEAPSYDRIVQNTLVYARVKWSDLSLVKEIEAHSPIKVTVNNT